MTSPAGFDSGGFLSSDEQIISDFTNVSTTADGRPVKGTNGTWSSSGGKAMTTTQRSLDPRLILDPAPFSDFEMQVDVGLGDAVYLRYVDESNWLRIAQYQTYSEQSFACNPYACNPYACNPFSCNPYACNPYACNPYACNPYACNPYSCNCQNTYSTVNSIYSNRTCLSADYGGYTAYSCRSCGSCCTATPCSASGGNSSQTAGAFCVTDSKCTQYTGQTCSTCFQTCYDTCFQTCFQTCYQTCFQTCFDTCFQTCFNYYYPTFVRLEKFVAGTLTLVSEVNIGTALGAGSNANGQQSRLRIIGKGTSIKVWGSSTVNGSPVLLIDQTVAEHMSARRFGVGRHGYGNQDTGTIIDNLVLTNAK